MKKNNVSSIKPSLFIGHGSPMNAIDDNDYTQHLVNLGTTLREAKGIIVISAHWLTQGVQVTTHQENPLIYDFYGFPEKLYRIGYPTRGSPQLSSEISQQLQNSSLTNHWGLDHGAWTVLMHLFKQPSVPVFQISLNKSWNLKEHYQYARSLKPLREQGYLIIGSGNIVHNLGLITWSNHGPPPNWALEFDQFVKEHLENRNYDALINPRSQQLGLWRQAHPSIDHFLPLLYILGSSEEHEALSFPYSGFQNSSISMRSVKIGEIVDAEFEVKN